MSDPRRHDDEIDENLPLVPGAGVGGTAGAMTPSDNSLFGPEPDPEPDSRGVNEEEVSTDTELIDSGASPEFDHSLRRRGSGS